jgi:hypothetical protein
MESRQKHGRLFFSAAPRVRPVRLPLRAHRASAPCPPRPTSSFGGKKLGGKTPPPTQLRRSTTPAAAAAAKDRRRRRPGSSSLSGPPSGVAAIRSPPPSGVAAAVWDRRPSRHPGSPPSGHRRCPGLPPWMSR